VKYEIFLEREVHRCRVRLPGNVRQRVWRVVHELAEEPRPVESTVLDLTGVDMPAGVEVRRYRVDAWRLVYAVNDEANWVWVLAVRRRPPYDYADLADLVARRDRTNSDSTRALRQAQDREAARAITALARALRAGPVRKQRQGTAALVMGRH
jgi:mRNA-degrading endonuclease RelE of RelBE toxin-antitoxin system